MKLPPSVKSERCYVTDGRWLARVFLGVGYVALLGALVLALAACFSEDWR